ncbi:MAG TPA: hypothetical protein VKZ18_14745 [Polyangia bacterium]|nr:hypothetical protein [Polyangia bacterium]
MARAPRALLLVAALALAGTRTARADDDPRLAAALATALPAEGRIDLVEIDLPSVPDAPRVRAATRVAATPAAIKNILLDPAHYQAIIPSLIKSDLETLNDPKLGVPVVGWELEVPLFNLSGRMALHNRPDGVTIDLFEGDFAPGRLVFTVAPTPGGATLSLDAVLDVKRSSWLLRRIIKRSPVGEPAALAAAAYVALRAVALRAEHPTDRWARRAGATPAPPPAWLPDTGPLAAPSLAPLRARGALAVLARTPSDRLGGVAVAVALSAPTETVAARLRDPTSWRAFPGWKTIRVRPGANGAGAEVEDDLPLVDCDATWIAEPGAVPRWVATAGATRGARLGWTFTALPGPSGAPSTLAALTLYPRLEQTGSVGRRFIAAEPLLEQGLALGLAFADLAGVKATFVTR